MKTTKHKISVQIANSLQDSNWDQFVDRSNNGTIFHKLSFLQYHPQERFNFHNLAFYEGNKLVAVLPGCVTEDIYKSPAGASYGGFVTKNVGLETIEAVVDSFITYVKKCGIHEIFLTPAPRAYVKYPNELFEYVLRYKGFVEKYHLVSNITLITDLKARGTLNESDEEILNFLSSMHRRAVRKSFKEGVFVEINDNLDEFYPILIDNKKKFDTPPTHTLEEIKKLKLLFPNEIKLMLAYTPSRIAVAGLLLFICNRRTVLTFYIAHYYKYQHYRAVNRLFYEALKWARNQNFSYLDLGVSMDTFSENPMEPSRKLIAFKEGINSRGMLRTCYHLHLI
ncbi:peptidoglycan bridge formation glycyltransferase FemA/FemB family protein [Patescibacteria group bacterium]|nr:peptidoglycan bridge formation glycyltransferase FemA/FemB family protein [Patescibacteria group bacterium]MBU1970379.1 peptidoglycan bridge formation glycyltransferase FemA/FemB family protein [Patescibacteria group bacterium]